MAFIRSVPSFVNVGGLGLLLLAGCGGTSTVTVNGKLVLPPNVKLVETDDVQILFSPEEKGAKSGFAKFSAAESTFVSKEISPGKYKIQVQLQAYPGMPETPKRAPALEALSKTYDLANTKLVYEFTKESPQSISIDLEKGTVAKN